MPTTTLFGLRYPAATDPDNPPQDLGFLAADVENKLGRALPVTSSTRPTGLSTGNRGFLIHESDTGYVLVWDGSTWVTPSNFTGGGGTGGTSTGALTTVSATYSATSVQSISTGTDVVVAFGVAQATDSAVTRNASGAGHSFTLGQARLWTVSATLRFAQTGTGGRTFELRAGSTVIAKAGADAPTDTPYTASLSVTRKFTAGTVITAVARHNAGSTISLDPSSGSYVHIDLAGV